MPPSEAIFGATSTAMPGRARVLLLMGEVYADGGIQRFNRTFVSACARLYVHCDVLTLNDSESSRTRWSAPVSINIRVFNRDKARFALALLRAVLFGKYDFIVVGHINLLSLVAGALIARRARRARTLFIAHGVEVWHSIYGHRRKAMRVMDTLLCVSRYTARMIQSQAPELAPDRFSIFPNALSESWADKFKVSADSGQYRTLPQRFLLSVTRLDRNDRYKGIVTALEAFAMLGDPSVHYVVAGRGDDREFLERVAIRLDVDERVHFMGGVSDFELAELYGRCAAFVLPSGKEGFGIVFLEAMYFGAPVIAADAKGATDVVQHENTGLLVPYGDVIALKEAMDRMLTNSQLSDHIRLAGRQTVSAGGRFTFEAYVQRLAHVFGVSVPAAASADSLCRSVADSKRAAPARGSGV